MRFASSFLFATTLLATSAMAADAGYHGPIIDAHAHIRFNDSDAVSPDQGKGTDPIRKLDDAAGVTQSALIVIARAGQMDKTRAQNDAVIAAAKAGRGRFYPVASVHPADGADAMAELDRLAAAGVKVIKLHPNSQNFDVSDPAVGAIVAHCGEKGLVVLFDSYKPWDLSEIGKFVLLTAQHPGTKLILAHMGFSTFRETLAFAQLRKLGIGGNVYFDLSAIAVAYAGAPVLPELVWTIRKIGTDHFLFGSDWPVDTPAVAEKAVRAMGFTAVEQKQIFHDNAAKLIGLK
jgi:predicted TIM-barrel fold metal-dependent hydrolase